MQKDRNHLTENESQLSKVPQEAPRSPWMTADQAWRYVGLPTVKALYQAIRRGDVPHYRCGRRLRFKRAELDAWLGSKPGWTLEGQQGILIKKTPVCQKRR